MKNVFFTVLIIVALFVFISCGKKSNPAGPAVSTATATATAQQASSTHTASFTYTCTETATVINTKTQTPSCTETASPTDTDTITATATVTATGTSTPPYGTITGNIILPSAQPGVVWQVMVDDNMTYSDGVENAVMNVCGASASVPYSITASAGTHYVYAIVKNASDILDLPIAGDHVGIYGAVYPAFPAAANVLAASNTNTTGIDINMTLAVNNVSGTITLPASADLRNITMVLDNDSNAYNGGHIYRADTQIPSSAGTSIPYNILIVFPGAWYIHAIVENDYYGQTQQFLPPVTGDFVGVSGPHTLDPAVPNTGYNFTLTVY